MVESDVLNEHVQGTNRWVLEGGGGLDSPYVPFTEAYGGGMMQRFLLLIGPIVPQFHLKNLSYIHKMVLQPYKLAWSIIREISKNVVQQFLNFDFLATFGFHKMLIMLRIF